MSHNMANVGRDAMHISANFGPMVAGWSLNFAKPIHFSPFVSLISDWLLARSPRICPKIPVYLGGSVDRLKLQSKGQVGYVSFHQIGLPCFGPV